MIGFTMRVISATIFVALLALLLLSCEGAVASNIVFEDDFTGDDGDAPDPDVWKVLKQDDNDLVQIDGDRLLTNTVNMGHTRVETADYFTHDEITILVDYYVTNTQGRPFDIGVTTYLGDRVKGMVTLCYDTGYGWHVYYRVDGNMELYVSHQRNLEYDTWYSINLTIGKDHFNVSLTERESGISKWSLTEMPLDPLRSENYIRFGNFAPNPGMSPRALWDNFKLYSLRKEILKPPIWGDLPAFQAVEDVPLPINFTNNVSDPDTPLHRLRLTSTSPYVKEVDNLTVTFVFTEGVTSAEVVLTLADETFKVDKTVKFNVTPVNDPPTCIFPPEQTVQEDVTTRLSFVPYVGDVDTPLYELFLEVDDPHASVEGLILTVTYPEGMTEANLSLWLSDGEASIQVIVHFTILPVDDPPFIDNLDVMEVIEDRPFTVDLSDHVHDVDTPKDQLTLSTDDDNCTVEGFLVTVMFTTGGIEVPVSVFLSDGNSLTERVLVFRVREMNDPPVIGEVPLQRFQEGQVKTIDLSPYVSDPDNDLSQLTVECDHPNKVRTEGLSITLLFDVWREDHVVEFVVFDSIAKTPGSFQVTIHDVNIPPEIVGIGSYEPPVVITVTEGTEHWFEVRVEDPDSSEFRFFLEIDWGNQEILPNGTLHITALDGDPGDHTGVVSVDDLSGGRDSLDFTVHVLSRNRPPSVPVILSPQNHSLFLVGTNVTFNVEVDDPDLPLGDILTIEWSSNVTGVLRTVECGPDQEFSTEVLGLGDHRITVTVTDGEFTKSAWVEISVIGEPGPDPEPPDQPILNTMGGSLLILVIIVLVVIIAFLVNKGRSQGPM